MLTAQVLTIEIPRVIGVVFRPVFPVADKVEIPSPTEYGLIPCPGNVEQLLVLPSTDPHLYYSILTQLKRDNGSSSSVQLHCHFRDGTGDGPLPLRAGADRL